MLMRLEFTVTYVSGQTKTVRSRPATEVAFERKFGCTIASLFSQLQLPADATPDDRNRLIGAFVASLKSDYLYFLAWHSTRSETPYDEWLEEVESIDWKFADTADPTPPAAKVES